MKILQKFLISFLIYQIDLAVFSLPIGFGINQGELRYLETKSNHFYVYHDDRASREGAMIVNALEAAKPILEDWLGKVRMTPFPVISGVTTDASFANFIYDTIELQTNGQGGRDLFWHEYVHSVMYRYFTYYFGPAESVLYLPWVPAWFIEGLAECLSASLGSDVIASIERYQSLSEDWPSFASLHSLYASKSSLQRYATSGAFVTWIFSKIIVRSDEFLKEFLTTLAEYTTPRYYPMTLNPFNEFMPMDAVLEKFVGLNAKELYEIYKKEAKLFWLKKKKGPLISEHPGDRLVLSGLSSLKSEGSHGVMLMRGEEKSKRHKLLFDPNTGWLNGTKSLEEEIPQVTTSNLHIYRSNFKLAVASKLDSRSGRSISSLVQLVNPIKNFNFIEKLVEVERLELSGNIYGLFESVDKVIWLENEGQESRLCYFPKNLLASEGVIGRSAIVCPLRVLIPQSIELLGDIQSEVDGESIDPVEAKKIRVSNEIWMAIKQETLVGDQYEIISWNPNAERIRKIPFQSGGYPIQLASTKNNLWLMVSEHNRRSIHKISPDGLCLGVFDLEDFPIKIIGLDDNSLVFGLYKNNQYVVRKIPENLIATRQCALSNTPNSPLLWAMRHPNIVHFSDALKGASIWTGDESKNQISHSKILVDDATNLAEASTKFGSGFVTPNDATDSEWRGRPIFALPWIGANDVQGTQFGLVSVPLLDHLQNETVRATILLGNQSKYLNTEMSLISTRFWPTIKVGVYKRQLWDGICQMSDGQTSYQSLSYLDEQGISPTVQIPWYSKDLQIHLDFGMRMSLLKPYLGECSTSLGRINEPYVYVSSYQYWKKIKLSYYGFLKIAPAIINSNLDYTIMGLGASGSLPLSFLNSYYFLGIEGSRTRGKQTFKLKEVYQPLKTFVPGSGGGYNKNNFSLIGDEKIFAIYYGDTQARFKMAWTFPIIKNLDKLFWLFYMESLNFSTFYNYGGAWNQGVSKISDRLVEAYGSKLDLLFKNKGVGFNTSLGMGKVRNEKIEVYASFGFDAFF